MNDDDKEFLKNLDMLMNMELIQNEKDWDMIQQIEDAEKDEKSEVESEDLKLEEE
jgi:hypothetical protein